MIFEIIKRAGFADGTESPDSTHDLGFESDDQENIYDDGKRIIGDPTLHCVIWILVDTNWSATSGFGFDRVRV